MPGRLVRSADFERVLQAPSRARSPHFAVHHVISEPARPAHRVKASEKEKLSTATVSAPVQAVDDLPAAASPSGLWVGVVVPKRHAKRSVTRSLLKREMRQAVTLQSAALGPGLWVVRLRQGFDRKAYPSAASAPLRLAARTELAELMASAVRRGPAR